MYSNVFFSAKHLQQQVLKRFIYSLQIEKDLCKFFYILYAAICDKSCLFNDLNIPRSAHYMVSEDSGSFSSLYEKDPELQYVFEFVWKGQYQYKDLHTRP